jgi:hypothetical protein
MNLYGCISFFNDGIPMLERALKSLKENGADFIVAVDGSWKGFPLIDGEQAEHSLPSQVECVKDYADIYINKAWESQVEKRNAYLRAVPGLDYFLILDADEQLMNEPDKDKLAERDFWNIRLRSPLSKSKSLLVYNRIFKKYDDLAYQKKHCALYYCNYLQPGNLKAGLVSLVQDYEFAPTRDEEDVLIHHYREERGEKRKKQRMAYAHAKTKLAKEPTIKLWSYGRDIKTRADYIEYSREQGWA